MIDAIKDPKKVTTVQKSSMDWDKFKCDEGLEDELAQATKDGYVCRTYFDPNCHEESIHFHKICEGTLQNKTFSIVWIVANLRSKNPKEKGKGYNKNNN